VIDRVTVGREPVEDPAHRGRRRAHHDVLRNRQRSIEGLYLSVGFGQESTSDRPRRPLVSGGTYLGEERRDEHDEESRFGRFLRGGACRHEGARQVAEGAGPQRPEEGR
jgi:hypothetical protein